MEDWVDMVLREKGKEEKRNDICIAFDQLREASILINDAFNTLDEYNQTFCLNLVEESLNLINKYITKIEQEEEYDGDDN